MYPDNMIPNYRMNMPRNRFGFRNNRNDRFFGGGFAVPFLLGGITGGLLSRPNNYYGGGPYPVFVPYSYNYNYPAYPTYSQNYYYY